MITIEPLLGLPRGQGPGGGHGAVLRGQYRSVKPFLINDEPPPDGRERLQSAGAAPALRRHDQVHPVRGCTASCPSSGRTATTSARRRSCRRTASSSTRATAARPSTPRRWSTRRRLALPHHLQLHARLPARDQHHQGHRRGERGDRAREEPAIVPAFESQTGKGTSTRRLRKDHGRHRKKSIFMGSTLFGLWFFAWG